MFSFKARKIGAMCFLDFYVLQTKRPAIGLAIIWELRSADNLMDRANNRHVRPPAMTIAEAAESPIEIRSFSRARNIINFLQFKAFRRC